MENKNKKTRALSFNFATEITPEEIDQVSGGAQSGLTVQSRHTNQPSGSGQNCSFVVDVFFD